MAGYKYFTKKELECRCGCGKAAMDAGFMAKVESLREQLGFPFIVTSAYRCPQHNQRVSSSGANGPHTTGRAIDIAVSGEIALALVNAALAAGITGLGIQQKGAGRFIHLDDLSEGYPRPNIWSY